jgi:hypothetical protein
MDFRVFRGRRTLAALVGTLALMLVVATGAEAKLVKVTGSTTVTQSQQATQFLANHGVSVAPVGPATAGGGTFTFPIVAGFGDTNTFNGVLAHSGGLRFTKGNKSVVVRRFVAVRAGGTALLLGQIPGLRGGCGQLKQGLARFLAHHPGVRRGLWNAARRYPRGARHVVRAVRNYCSEGRVIVLARLTNLSKSVANGTATLSADLQLSRQAARLINRVAGQHTVNAGAPLGSAVSTVTPVAGS